MADTPLSSAKHLCVAKELAALLACHAKAAKPPGLAPGKLDRCLQTVDETENFSQMSDGAVVTQSHYRRLRIDPATLVVDLLDDAFATMASGTLVPPAGRSSVPAGFAEFASPNDGDGPPAQAKIDLTGTPFIFTEAILANGLEYFSAATDDQSPADGGNVVTVVLDLRSFTLAAIDPRGSHTTKMVADGAITTGTLALQYLAE